MAEERIPTYFLGDLICVGVEVGSIGRGIHRVAARFAHEADTSREIELSDDPASVSECRVQRPGKVELAGRIVDGVHPPGVYGCRSITVAYLGGRMVRFADVPDVRFRVAARSPEVVEWRWVRQTGANAS